MPALALERVAGCAPGGSCAPCLDSAIHYSRRIYDFLDDFPQRLVRFKEESGPSVGGAEPPSRNRPPHGKAVEVLPFRPRSSGRCAD